MPNSTPRFKIPYPADREDPFYTSFQSMILFLDQLNFGQFEDINEIVYTDGNVSWIESSGIHTLSFNNDLIFVSSSFGREETLPVLTPPLEIDIPVNHYLVFQMTRGATTSVDLTTHYTIQTQLPTLSTDRILCYHAPNHKLYFTTNLVMDVGDTVTGIDPSGSGSGATQFTALTDTPNNYVGESLKAVRVDSGETGLEFYTPSTSGAGVSKFIEIDIDHSGSVFDSTTIIPDGAKVLDVKVQINSVYDAGNSIVVDVVGGSLENIMQAGNNNPNILGIYVQNNISDITAITTGIVRVVISGALTIGDGKVLIQYVDWFLP